MASTDFKNFELATRLPNIVDFGLLPTGDLSWIATNFNFGGSPYEEVPAGTKDGVNTSFTVLNQTYARTLVLKNRLVLNESDGDYTLVGATLTFAEAPESDDSILFWGWVSA